MRRIRSREKERREDNSNMIHSCIGIRQWVGDSVSSRSSACKPGTRVPIVQRNQRTRATVNERVPWVHRIVRLLREYWRRSYKPSHTTHTHTHTRNVGINNVTGMADLSWSATFLEKHYGETWEIPYLRTRSSIQTADQYCHEYPAGMIIALKEIDLL